MTRRCFRRAAFGAALALAALPAVASAETRVTRDATAGSYVRYDGAADATMLACSTGRRTQNEPSVAVHPARPDVVVAGSNDYCAEMTNGVGNVWAGYYRSTNGGATWTNSLVPGYPADASAAGHASPTQGVCAAAGDPTQAFDAAGRLYYGFICFNRAKPTNGGIYVARYEHWWSRGRRRCSDCSRTRSTWRSTSPLAGPRPATSTLPGRATAAERRTT
jgi:hypothetical protein